MLKAGIYLDVANLFRNGGRGMDFAIFRELVESEGYNVLRANAYISVDVEREQNDPEYRRKGEEYRNAIRRKGFHPVIKEVSKYYDADGNEVLKANADVDLTVDALLQAENLDYVVLGTGDGDFLRLVRALQNRGKRVDVLSFDNTSWKLKKEADHYLSGYLVPSLLPIPIKNGNENSRKRGVMYQVDPDAGYGFIMVQTGFNAIEASYDIFLHITNITSKRGIPMSNDEFAGLKTHETIIEFDLESDERGRDIALNARVM